ncbi:MAG: hypothetical protein P8J49_00490 [SAR324 cluster bacterium]|nr:hypothetical protein [SAR324 cluster bacterium]
MKYLLIICALCWNWTGTAIAAPEKSEVMKLLEGRHWKIDVVAFQSLGDDTDSVLIKIAEDTAIINYLRFRALEALSLFPSEKTGVFLEQTADKSFAALARRGFEALKNGFSKTEPERVKKLAERLLHHRNAQVRISAARAVRSLDTARFESFLKAEKDSWVRKEAQK